MFVTIFNRWTTFVPRFQFVSYNRKNLNLHEYPQSTHNQTRFHLRRSIGIITICQSIHNESTSPSITRKRIAITIPSLRSSPTERRLSRSLVWHFSLYPIRRTDGFWQNSRGINCRDLVVSPDTSLQNFPAPIRMFAVVFGRSFRWTGFRNDPSSIEAAFRSSSLLRVPSRDIAQR